MPEAPFTMAIYNPALLKKEDLIGRYVARLPLLDRLLDDLRREQPGSTPQHQIIIGQRGLGKTTLLRRLAFAVEDDAALAAQWIALVFPEEQYNVASLADFWLNCVDALSDALDRAGDRAASQALDARVEERGYSGEGGSAAALRLLVDEAERLGRRILLLVDNIDIVLDRLKDEAEWEFRRVISHEPRLHFIGASSRVLEALYEHGRAFYDFFQVHELKGFDEQETFSTLCQLAEQAGNERVLAVIREQPARIKALRVLTGGNPRTLALLFNVLSQGPEGDVQRDIEQLLDGYTALYKARFEELPAQAQLVVDAMAIHWDPLTAADLTALLGPMAVNQVSAQLKRLEDLGVVEKTPWYGEKKNAFQIAERFFNIWYLMRASRRVRRRLLWLVKFLETWFGAEELRERARGFLARDRESVGNERYAEMALAYSQAVPDRHLRRSLESAGLHAVLDDGIGRLIDFDDLPEELQDRRARIQQMRDLRVRMCGLRIDWGGIEPEEFWRLLGGCPQYSVGEKVRMVEKLERLRAEEVKGLFEKLRRIEGRLLEAFRSDSEAVRRLYAEMAAGDIADAYDLDGAIAASKRFGLRRLPYIAIRSRTSQWHAREALSEIEIVVAEGAIENLCNEKGFEAEGFMLRANLLSEYKNKLAEAEQAYRRAIELDPEDANSWNNLGRLLHRLNRFAEAEVAYRQAIELDPQDSVLWEGLGDLLADHLNRCTEAERAYRHAIELDPQNISPWSSLGNLLADRLNRSEEAEQAYRRAIGLEPQEAFPWYSLGNLLKEHPLRYDEAEQAFRRAIELYPQFDDAWNGLGILLAEHLNRFAEAEQAYRRAIELDPKSAFPWSNLGLLLERFPDRRREAAEASLRAYELTPERKGDLDHFRRLCGLLAESADEMPAALALAQKAAGLAPNDSETQFLTARLLALAGRWVEAAQMLEKLASDEETFYSADFFRAAIRTGRLEETIRALEKTGAHERWRPLYEALRALRAGSRDYLNTVAPEVRMAALEILEELTAQEPDSR
jgi:Flp pilus assembly protein TadD